MGADEPQAGDVGRPLDTSEETHRRQRDIYIKMAVRPAPPSPSSSARRSGTLPWPAFVAATQATRTRSHSHLFIGVVPVAITFFTNLSASPISTAEKNFAA